MPTKSKVTKVTNVDTNESVIYDSMSEAGRRSIGTTEVSSQLLVGKLCKFGGVHNGHTFEVIEDHDDDPPRVDWSKTAIFQVNKNNGEVITYFGSVSDAGKFGYSNFVHNSSDADQVRKSISNCVHGHIRSAYGFKWRKVRDDQRPENVPLPEPDEEGL